MQIPLHIATRPSELGMSDPEVEPLEILELSWATKMSYWAELSYWTKLLSWAKLLNWAELRMSYLISLKPLLFKNIAHVLYFLNFAFVFVFVCVFVFVVVFVVFGWTPMLSSFRRCMKCWVECWNRGNREVLLIIGLMAGGGEEGEGRGEGGEKQE